jgi:ectoine hydroxylase-related dioxygenase (phytanoyl-CoA dioxygenase family)
VRPEERAAGALDPTRLAEAQRALLHDGLVVLDDAIDVGHVDILRERMEADLTEVASRETGERRHNRQGHLQHQPPVDAEFLFPDVIANAVAVSLTRAVVGTVQLVLYTANTNLPGSVRQHVHADLNQLWPDLEIAPAAHMLVANVPLVETTPANATELWPGTHRDTRTYRSDLPCRPGRIAGAWLDARRAQVPPVQVSQRKGSILLRDVRLWHGGVSNTTGTPRVMLAMCYAATWYAATPLTFGVDAERVIATLLRHLDRTRFRFALAVGMLPVRLLRATGPPAEVCWVAAHPRRHFIFCSQGMFRAL